MSVSHRAESAHAPCPVLAGSANTRAEAVVRGEPGWLSVRNELASQAAVRPDYRNDSGAGVSAEDLSDLLLATSKSAFGDPQVLMSRPTAPSVAVGRGAG